MAEPGPLAKLLAAMLLAAGPAAAQTPAPGLLLTHAEASRRLPNTVSDATATVEVHGRDLRTTAALLARQSQTLLGFLRGQKTERLRTEVASFSPELQEIRNAPDRIKGYTGTQTISFRTAPDQLPAMLSGSLDNGATAVAQSGASPREEEVEAAHAELVARAAKSAMEQARQVAAAVGQRVTGVERLEVDPETGFAERAMPVRMLALPAPSMAAPPPPPIATEAGDAPVSAAVRLSVRLAPAD